MDSKSKQFLEDLLTAASPSGYESPAQRVWVDYVSQFADEVTTDAYGNAIAVLNPGAKTRVLLDGHIDEIGMIVKHISKEGYVYVQRNGGVDVCQVPAKRVNIHTKNGIVRGVCGATAVHLQEKDAKDKAPKWHDVYVDLGVKDDEEAKALVAVGDFITFSDGFEMLNENIAVSRALDDRIGCWLAAEALRKIKESGQTLNCSLHVCSTIQEETGCNGAQMTVAQVKPHCAIAVEVTHATDVPGINPNQHGLVKLGEGPTVSIGREHHPVVVRRLRDLAEANDIAHQIETFSLSGGTNAIKMWTANGGTPCALISLPTRYMHSTVEMMDMRDITKSIDWLAAFALDIKDGERFKVEV
ncbi:MAG: M42 family metallopeptidase [Phycisphaerales bacterium]|jgi:putative aminopeptidase FrvX|nr:M42 family metallopeptidase [Phycisphaerales bacterium]